MERRMVQLYHFRYMPSILMCPHLSYARYPLFVTKDSYLTKKNWDEEKMRNSMDKKRPRDGCSRNYKFDWDTASCTVRYFLAERQTWHQ
jgi:hypothetical protein